MHHHDRGTGSKHIVCDALSLKFEYLVKCPRSCHLTAQVGGSGHATATRAPSPANATAVAWPMPDELPVISMTSSFNPKSIVGLLAYALHTGRGAANQTILFLPFFRAPDSRATSPSG